MNLEPNSDSQKIEILLVDDRPENLLSLEAILSSAEYSLAKAHSGDEALRYLLSNEPALILMDVQMPDLDGFETVSIIKKSERTRSIPIIFITAINLDERYVHQGYAHGAVDYIYKPFDAQILKSKVSVFVELAKKTRQLLLVEQQLRENEKKQRAHHFAQLELKSLKREQMEQKKFRDLVNDINHGIVWAADAESLQLTFISQSAESILGYTAYQQENEPHFLIKNLHPDDLDPFLDAIKRVRTSREDVEIEHRFLTSTDKTIWLQTGLRIARISDEEGEEIRGLSVDITAHKEANELIQANTMRSDFLAHASSILSESFDIHAAIEKLCALAVQKFSSICVMKLTQDHQQPEIFKAASDGFKADIELPIETALDVEKICHSSSPSLDTDFSPFFVNASAATAPLMSRGVCFGAVAFVRRDLQQKYIHADLAMVEDLGRRVAVAIDNSNLYLKAQTAIMARDEFLSIASHELKTPLTPLKIQTQSLMRSLSLGTLKEDKALKMLTSSDRQIGRLSRLIDDLLDISRIGMGKLSLSFERFDLTELLTEVLERFSGQVTNANCEVILHNTLPIQVQWDRFRIEQVVINLLTNAIKYGAGQKIEIRTELVGQEVFFSFQDHGIGIAKEDQARVFGRFERAVSGSHFGGLGLGLYIVTQILNSHRGRIELESELGHGSTFKVTLPVEVEHEKVPEVLGAP